MNSRKGAEEFIGGAVLFDHDNDVSDRTLTLSVGRSEEQKGYQESLNRGLDRAFSKRLGDDVCDVCLLRLPRLHPCHWGQLREQLREP